MTPIKKRNQSIPLLLLKAYFKEKKGNTHTPTEPEVMLYFLHATLFPCCFFHIALVSCFAISSTFHVFFFCYFFVLHFHFSFFCVSLFSFFFVLHLCFTFFLLHFFRVNFRHDASMLFSCCTFFLLHSFHIALVSCFNFFMLLFFRVNLCSCCFLLCCILLMLLFLPVALFSCCTVMSEFC